MWKNPKSIVLTAVTAALFAAVYVALAPFNLYLIPGVLAFSIRDLFIQAFGMLFGPAGAWGLGIGNTIGDFFTGNLALGSVFGFLTNYMVGYLGYTLWQRHGQSKRTGKPASRARQVTVYLLISLITAGAGTVTLAWGLNVLGLAPFKIVAVSLFANLVIGNTVGGLLYRALYQRISVLRMSWDAIMPATGSRHPAIATAGITLLAVGGLGGLGTGLLLVGTAALTPVVAIFFAMVLLGMFLA
jgi:energy-coupling factor transport system substrate-specific component